MRPGPLLAALALGLAACSSGPTAGAARPAAAASATAVRPPSPVPPVPPAATPSPTAPAATAAPARSGLVLSGPLSGRSDEMHSAGVCGATPAGYAARLTLAMSGHAYGLTVEILDYRGAGRYSVPPERISLLGGGQDPQPLYPAVSGTVEVDPAGRSGSLDVALSVPGGTSRLSGEWTC